MDFSKTQIAKLVLGYLRSVNCVSACKEFLSTSPDLRECMNSIKKDKFFVTRVAGLSLLDILNEYAQISTLVQARLEASNYYDEKGTKTSLIEQLSFLLDNARDMHIETPIPFSRCSTPYRPREFDRSSVRQCSPDNSIYNEFIHDDLKATQLQNLPGYSSFAKVPKRRSPPRIIQTQAEAPSPDHNISIHQTEVLTQTMLEHQELCEKLAENINSVRKNTAEEQISAGAERELDAKIKTIVQKIEKDNMFDQLLGEILGSTEVDGSVPNESDRDEINTSEASTRKSLRNKPIEEEHIIAGQNKDAIDSIIAVAKSIEPINQSKVLTPANPLTAPRQVEPQNDLSKALNINTSSDVIMYDGTMDNFIKNSSANQQPVIISQSGLLMVQPSTTPTQQITTPSKSCYIINGPRVFPVQQAQYTKCNIITEQDIMSMPTVIVSQSSNTSVPQPTVAKKKGPKKAMPKGKVGVGKFPQPTNPVREVIKLQNTTKSSPGPKMIKRLLPARVEKSSAVKKAKVEKVSPRNLTVKNDDVEQNPAKVTCIEVKQNSTQPEVHLPSLHLTPDLKAQEAKKTTPKSSSHVRQLDFNHSPTKTKTATPPKSAKKIHTSKTPKKVTNLVHKKEEKVEVSKPSTAVAEKSRDKKNAALWDADLRALAKTGAESPSPKKSRKRARVKCYTKKKKDDSLNKTESDAAAIEQALISLDENSDEKECGTKKSNSSPKKTGKKAKSKNTQNAESQMQSSSSSVKDEEVAQTENNQEFNENQMVLVNVNGKPRYKKKCNIENTKKDIKITKVKEIKVLDIIADSSNKLILSPSKLNASKRSLLDNKESSGQITQVDNASSEKVDESNGSKFITPELSKAIEIQPVTAKCNITAMLETPMKLDLPKTPGFFSPVNAGDTPFTRVFKEQLQGIDILNIQTPRFPLTPCIPITPQLRESGYSNRPTDYSTSSSYYQPSDSEQNKSLEQQIIEECKRLEKTTPLKKRNDQLPGGSKDKNNQNDDDHSYHKQGNKPIESEHSAPDKKYATASKALDLSMHNNQQNSPKDEQSNLKNNQNITSEQKEKPQETTQERTDRAISERIMLLKSQLIGRKNLQLVKETASQRLDSDTSSSDDTSEGSDSDSSSPEEHSSWSGSDKEKTVINNKGTPKEKPATRFSMRLRSKQNTSLEEQETTNSIQNILKSYDCKETLDTKSETKSTHFFQEIEEKKKRTIAKIKNTKEPPSKVGSTKKPTQLNKSNDKNSNINTNEKEGTNKPEITISTENKNLNTPSCKRNIPSSTTNAQPTKSTAQPSRPKENKFDTAKMVTSTPNVQDILEEKKIELSKSKTSPSMENSEPEILFHLSTDDEADDQLSLIRKVNEALPEVKDVIAMRKTPENKITHKEDKNIGEKLATVHKESETIKNDESKETEGDKLVKDLEMRGIHLVRNKSVPRDDAPKHEETLEEGEVVSEEDEINKNIPVKKRRLSATNHSNNRQKVKKHQSIPKERPANKSDRNINENNHPRNSGSKQEQSTKSSNKTSNTNKEKDSKEKEIVKHTSNSSKTSHKVEETKSQHKSEKKKEEKEAQEKQRKDDTRKHETKHKAATLENKKENIEANIHKLKKRIEPQSTDTISPLENLYSSEEPSNYIRKNNPPSRRHSKEDTNESQSKKESSQKTSLKNLERADRNPTNSKSLVPDKIKSTDHSKSDSNKVDSENQDKSNSKPIETTPSIKSIVKDLSKEKVVEKKVPEKAKTPTNSESSSTSPKAQPQDDLMDLALVGMQHSSDRPNKRKAPDNPTDEENPTKKASVDYSHLLKRIDVDGFLKHLYGEESEEKT